MTTTKRREATVSILWCSIILLPKALSLRCFSCAGDLSVNCEDTMMEIECQPTGSLVYDSCFTLSKVMKYPFIGISYEQTKNCSVLSDCDFLENIFCYDPDGFLSNCSINCCTGDLCNGNRTLVNASSTITDENVTRTITDENATSTITDINVTRTTTDENITLTRTDKNVLMSTIEGVDAGGKKQTANITSLATYVHTTIIYMHPSSTSTSRQLHIKSTITDETALSRTLHTSSTVTRSHMVRLENVTNTFTYPNATNTSYSKSSITHLSLTVTRSRHFEMDVISSTSWKPETQNVTEAQVTLPTPDATRLAGISSVTVTHTTTTSSRVVAVYGGAARTWTQLTFVLFLVTLIAVMAVTE